MQAFRLVLFVSIPRPRTETLVGSLGTQTLGRYSRLEGRRIEVFEVSGRRSISHELFQNSLITYIL